MTLARPVDASACDENGAAQPLARLLALGRPAVMGVLNLYVAFNYTLETWVNFKLFGGIGLMLSGNGIGQRLPCELCGTP